MLNRRWFSGPKLLDWKQQTACGEYAGPFATFPNCRAGVDPDAQNRGVQAMYGIDPVQMFGLNVTLRQIDSAFDDAVDRAMSVRLRKEEMLVMLFMARTGLPLSEVTMVHFREKSYPQWKGAALKPQLPVATGYGFYELKPATSCESFGHGITFTEPSLGACPDFDTANSADDLVLSAGARASEYAGHLLEVARTLQTGPAMGRAAVAMARRSQLEGRLLAILDSGVNRAAAGRASLLAAVLLAVALVAPLAAVRAQQSQTQAPAIDGNAADAAIRAARSQNNYERLENAGNAAAELRMYDIAHKLLDAALLIRAELFGEQSTQYGVGILKLAALENKQNHEQAAGELYTKAAHLLGEQPEAAPALIHLGITAIDKKDFPQAMEYFQHVRRLNLTQAGAAMMWMAVVEQRQQHMDEAEKLYQGALAIQDPKSAEAAITMEVYGQFLRKQGRADQAGEMDTRAAAIQAANVPSPVSHTGPLVYKASSAGVRAPSLVSKVEPEYSEEGRAAGLEGTIIVGVVIGLDGMAHDARILRGLGLGLDEQAVEAIQQWRFKPGLKDGQPVPVAATIEVNWRLL